MYCAPECHLRRRGRTVERRCSCPSSQVDDCAGGWPCLHCREARDRDLGPGSSPICAMEMSGTGSGL